MQITQNKAFTLVELLVVITILAILSITAYQSFGGATDKAQNTTKKSNVAMLGNTLGIFFTDTNYYPMPQELSSTNLWGYTGSTTAQISNTIEVNYEKQEILDITASSTAGGGIIYGTGAWAEGESDEKQIAAKGVIGNNGAFNKKYLKEEIYDNQLGDIKLTTNGDKMIDYGIGKFVYAVYARASTPTNWNTSGTRGTYFTLGATFKQLEGEGFETYITGNYSKDNFTTDKDKYPENLLGLKQGQIDLNVETDIDDQGIPYPIDNFKKGN